MHRVLWDGNKPVSTSCFATAPLLRAEIKWMSENAQHLNFQPVLEKAEIDQQVHDLLWRCQKKAAGGSP